MGNQSLKITRKSPLKTDCEDSQTANGKRQKRAIKKEIVKRKNIELTDLAENPANDLSNDNMKSDMDPKEKIQTFDLDRIDQVAKKIKQDKKLIGFEDFCLDLRLLKAIEAQNYKTPTRVQEQAIPLALKGQDLIIRATTGSGKTACYLIPIIDMLLKKTNKNINKKTIEVVIIVPSKELAQQVQEQAQALATFALKQFSIANLAAQGSVVLQNFIMSQVPEIVVTTPSRFLQHLKEDNNDRFSLISHIIFDEADLLFSFGYEDDVREIAKAIPRFTQIWMISATVNREIKDIQKITGRTPTIVEVNDEESRKLTEYKIFCSESDKFLIAYLLLKLQLIKGKKLIFVNNIDRCYRLKLFLEKFGLRSVVLNSTLPINSRMHIVNQINQGLYQIAIATDECDYIDVNEDIIESQEDEKGLMQDGGASELQNDTRKKIQSLETTKDSNKSKKKGDTESGVVRGVDFTDISCVLNFDIPISASNYIHRVGRTARAGKKGVAMSLIVPKDKWGKEKHATLASARRDENVWKLIEKENKDSKRNPIELYKFNDDQISAFRYRVRDALRSVTSILVKEARRKELKQEILVSEKLKKYFDEAPHELQLLRHDKDLFTTRQAHLKNIPDYLLPNNGKSKIAKPIGFVPYKKSFRKKKAQSDKKNYSSKSFMRRKNLLKSL